MLLISLAHAADFYACDCVTGADADCVPGSDTADGSESTPWQTYDKAREAFSTSMTAGDTLHLCQGGAFAVTTGSRWANGACLADTPCTVTDYTPSWASGDEGRPRVESAGDTAFALEDGGDAEHEEGYVFSHLELVCTDCADSGANGFFLYNDVDDVAIDDVVVDGFDIGVHLAGSNPCSDGAANCDGRNDRLWLTGSTIRNNHAQGFLGAGDGVVIDGNTFQNNGTRSVLDHNVYYSGAQDQTTGSVISNNVLYQSSIRETGACAAVSLVVHGDHADLTLSHNVVSEDVGAAEPGCWGIAVDAGYDGEAEGFQNLVITGNVVSNVGNVGIGISSCSDCIIENNVIIHEQDFSVVGIAAPDRTDGDEDAVMDAVTVRNNSLYLTGPGGVGIQVGTEGTNHLVVSNAILYDGTGTFDCFASDLATSIWSAHDYNICHYPSAADGEWMDGYGALADWLAATSRDPHSIEDDPGYNDAAAYDLSSRGWQVNLIDNGHPDKSSTEDILGTDRAPSPDVGAYEKKVEGDTDTDADSDSDADTDVDTDTDTDTDADTDTGGTGDDDKGCGCSTSPAPFGWLALTLLWTRRRRAAIATRG